MVKSNLHGHTNKLDILKVALEKETATQRWHVWFCKKKKIHDYCVEEVHVSQNSILNYLKLYKRQSSLVYFPDHLHSTLLLAVLSSHLPQHISLLHPAKPIRDLRASIPINYHPNQCRGLWYRIICQISADGLGQVPLCHRPYPHGNLCQGWALPMLPNLLMASHCVLQDCSPAAWSPRLLIYKHLSLSGG